MKTIPFGEVDPKSWDGVVDASTQAWLFHRTAWVRIETEFWAQANHSFAVLDDHEAVIGTCPFYRRDLPRGWTERILDSGHHRHTGPAFRDDLAPEVRKASIAVCMRHILQLAEKEGVDRVLLNAHNLAPANLGDRAAEVPYWVREHGFQLGMAMGAEGDESAPGLSTLAADQIVSLRLEEVELFRRMDEDCRKAVRKAERGGVTVSEAADGFLNDYYGLAQASAQRTGEELPPKEYYAKIWASLGADGRCVPLFARRGGKPVAALLLLIDKSSASFFAGVSDPEYLPLRVNNLLHWEAMRWAKSRGLGRYRLGPIFPELPDDWPISRVSRFKAGFGGSSLPIIQGSLYLRPERYRESAIKYVERRCGGNAAPHASADAPAAVATDRCPERGWTHLLRSYGYIGPTQADGGPRPYHVGVHPMGPGACLWEVSVAGSTSVDSTIQWRQEKANALLYRPRTWLPARRRPAYRPVLPFLSFRGPGLKPLWCTADGWAVVAERSLGGRRSLLLGIDFVEEIVRYRQGNPARIQSGSYRGGFGFDTERPNYLYDGQVLSVAPTVPWADRLGYLIAEALARLTDWPLVEPLPGGIHGLVLLTGDDDQADLDRYQEQLREIQGLPITYFLHILTRHTKETLSALPPSTEIGLHPDALESPADYDRLCADQARVIRERSMRPARVVRNHGFLSRGYLGHLGAWETTGLELDVNLPGVDGTALNASFLPGPVRRADGTWSTHRSLLTAFGDGMVCALRMTESQAVRRIRQVVSQVERDGPAVLVFNLHPQNVPLTRRIHREVRAVATRKGWRALGCETYLDWLKTLDSLTITATQRGFQIASSRSGVIEGSVMKLPSGRAWKRISLPTWSGCTAVHSGGCR